MKFLGSLLLLFLSFTVYSFEIDQVEITCLQKKKCDVIEDSFDSIRRQYNSVEHFYKIFKLYVANEGIKTLSFVIEEQNNSVVLKIKTSPQKVVERIEGPRVKGGYDVDFPSILPIKEDEYFDQRKLVTTRRLLQDIARDKGFPKAQIRSRLSETKDGDFVVVLDVNLGRPQKVKLLNVTSKSNRLKELALKKIGYNLHLPFDPQKIKNELEDLRKVFLQYGYYLVDFNFKHRFAGEDVEVFLDIVNTQTFSFHPSGNKVLDSETIKSFFANQLISLKRKSSLDNLKSGLMNEYRKLGYLYPDISITQKESKNKFGDKNTHTFVNVKEYSKTFFSKIKFKGNSFFKGAELRELFYQNSTEIVDAGIVDEEYFEQFRKKLREFYISNGFVSVFIDEPALIEVPGKGIFDLNFRIREGIQTKVEKLKVQDLPRDLVPQFREVFVNQKGASFNPIRLKEDIEALKKMLQNNGYYFAEILNQNSPNLVTYTQDNARVNIELILDLGPKMSVGNILIIGNRTTRKILIRREITFKEGALLTRADIERSQTNLLALGLFSSVQIKPVSKEDEITDVLIFVREKDFGQVEIAPGIRTDIGLKLSTVVNYNNLDGMNKRISFKGTVNRRFDLFALDERRRRESASLVEYDANINYTENHIFYSDYDFTLALNKSRKRFFSFDADIQRISYSVSRDFTAWLNVSIRQQLETISQFDASQERDDGFFQIGSFTPSVTLDFRDRSVNPTRGSYFDLSVEFANPLLLSQQNEDLTIDYYKLTSRNRFYFPIHQDLVFAVSTAFGIQENRATGIRSDGQSEGYIPGIKVFRLIGADIIRGFEDEEMNRLSNGSDISAVEVDRRAYMVNLKLEPRYYLSDATILGLFYDAGRVFVDEFDSNDLRSAAGVSFKYITPVGTLDFDYGIKLLRNRDSDGNLETPGRLHVSIGFF